MYRVDYCFLLNHVLFSWNNNCLHHRVTKMFQLRLDPPAGTSSMCDLCLHNEFRVIILIIISSYIHLISVSNVVHDYVSVVCACGFWCITLSE